MTSQMNLGNISKEHLSFNTINDVPKDFTGLCYISCSLYYYQNGKIHRTNGPAIKHPDGRETWVLNGEYHREDGPALEFADGKKFWYINGKYHREDGPAIEHPSGYKVWCIHGMRHRTDGPAKEYLSNKWWYLNNKEYGKFDDFTNESWKHFQRTLIF